MRKDRIVAFGARAEIDMAALAGNRNPGVGAVDDAGDAQSGSRTDDDAVGRGDPRTAADRLEMLGIEGDDGKRLAS